MSNKQLKQIKKVLPLIPCEPPVWAWDRHSQTILGEMLPSPGLLTRGQKMVVKFPDGDRVVCRLYDQGSPTMIILFHGLAGSTNSKYMQRVARELLKEGYSVCMMNHRNCGEGKGLAKEIYHCGRSDDLGYVISDVRLRFPSKKIVALGFSMSANALLLLCSGVVPMKGIYTRNEFTEASQRLGISLPDLAIAINPPIDLEKTTSNFDYFTNRPYTAYFLSYLAATISDLNKDDVLKRRPPPISWLMKIKEFDHHFTAPQSGFESSADYYKKCSSKEHLTKVETPTIIFHSKDDPFISVSDLEEVKVSDKVHIHIENAGGHLGYIHRENTPRGTNRWMDYAITETLKL